MSTFGKPRRRRPRVDEVSDVRPSVARMLDDARSPGTPSELAREVDAVLLFNRAKADRAAGLFATVSAVDRPARRGIQAVIATAGVAVLTTGGLAVAASGHAPWSHPSPPAWSVSHHPSGTDGSEPSTDLSSHSRGPGGTVRHGNRPAPSSSTESSVSTAPTRATSDTTTAGPGAHLHPTDPTHPGHPVHPTHPPHTSHPHPMHPMHPTHPTHPAHPAHPHQG